MTPNLSNAQIQGDQSISRDKTTHRIAIVGAGASGIVCGRELRKRGWKNVTIFEGAAEPGGKTRSITVAGSVGGQQIPIELCTFSILRSPVIEEIIEEVGLTNELTNHKPVKYFKLSRRKPYSHLFSNGNNISFHNVVLAAIMHDG